MISPKFERLFGAPPRTLETPITDPLYMDVAASIQKVIEEIRASSASLSAEEAKELLQRLKDQLM